MHKTIFIVLSSMSQLAKPYARVHFGFSMRKSVSARWQSYANYIGKNHVDILYVIWSITSLICSTLKRS